MDAILIDAYDIVSITLSFIITLVFATASFYGIKYFLYYRKNGKSTRSRYHWTIHLVTVVGILWTFLYAYLFITGLMHIFPIPPDSFAALYSRPLILLTGIAKAIFLRIEYREACCGRIR